MSAAAATAAAEPDDALGGLEVDDTAYIVLRGGDGVVVDGDDVRRRERPPAPAVRAS